MVKRGVRVGVVAMMACASMADAVTNMALPDMTAALRRTANSTLCRVKNDRQHIALAQGDHRDCRND